MKAKAVVALDCFSMLACLIHAVGLICMSFFYEGEHTYPSWHGIDRISSFIFGLSFLWSAFRASRYVREGGRG